MRDLKETLCTGSSCVNHTFWNTLPVEVGKLLDEMVILKKDRTCQDPTQTEVCNVNISYRCKPYETVIVR